MYLYVVLINGFDSENTGFHNVEVDGPSCYTSVTHWFFIFLKTTQSACSLPILDLTGEFCNSLGLIRAAAPCSSVDNVVTGENKVLL
jgi:hypothetical protein